jgi:hypothetical protein
MELIVNLLPTIILSSSFSKDFWLYRDPHSRSLENCAGSKSSSHSNSYQINRSALNPSTSIFSSKLSYMGRKKSCFVKSMCPTVMLQKKSYIVPKHIILNLQNLTISTCSPLIKFENSEIVYKSFNTIISCTHFIYQDTS